MKETKINLLFFLFLSVYFSCTKAKQQSPTTVQQATKEMKLDTAQWKALFNNKNLEGWEVKSVKEDQQFNFWSVKDGAIIVNSIGETAHDYSWLQTKKEYADFELKLKFQSYRESTGNSGVQIRSRYDSEGKVKASSLRGWLDGPQVDIHPSDPWRTGFIYDETRAHQRWIYPDLPDWNIDKSVYAPKHFRHYYADESPHWNDLVIICRGTHITTIVNDILVADYDGRGVLDDAWHQKYGIDKKGFIALQLHKEDQLKMAFKDIMIREL